MVHFAPKDGDFVVDLECGRTSNDENVSLRGEDWALLLNNESDSSDNNNMAANVTVVIGKKLEGDEAPDLENKKVMKEKHKNNKKAPKPPRPPKGPSLCEFDQKFIKEISELAMLKRAKIERMKALKKAKASKASSSSTGNMIAMAVTIFFFIVIVFQGLCSKTTAPITMEGSPKSAAGNLISVQYYRNISPNERNELESGSPRLVEQVSGLEYKST